MYESTHYFSDFCYAGHDLFSVSSKQKSKKTFYSTSHVWHYYFIGSLGECNTAGHAYIPGTSYADSCFMGWIDILSCKG